MFALVSILHIFLEIIEISSQLKQIILIPSLPLLPSLFSIQLIEMFAHLAHFDKLLQLELILGSIGFIPITVVRLQSNRNELQGRLLNAQIQIFVLFLAQLTQHFHTSLSKVHFQVLLDVLGLLRLHWLFFQGLFRG